MSCKTELSCNTSKGFFSVNQIKMIALVCMTLDHLGKNVVFLFSPLWSLVMQIVGRLAAPLFLFALIEGLWHTRSKVNYACRMYLASISFYIPHYLVSKFHEPSTRSGFCYPGNILPTFFCIIVLVHVIEQVIDLFSEKKNHAVFSVIGLSVYILISASLSEVYPDSAIRVLLFPYPYSHLDYAYFIPLGCVMYFAKSKNKSCFIFGAFSLAYFLQTFLGVMLEQYPLGYLFLADYQWFMALALPFMLLCNETRGRSIKSFFYSYYLLHNFVFYLVGQYLSSFIA